MITAQEASRMVKETESHFETQVKKVDRAIKDYASRGLSAVRVSTDPQIRERMRGYLKARGYRVSEIVGKDTLIIEWL